MCVCCIVDRVIDIVIVSVGVAVTAMVIALGMCIDECDCSGLVECIVSGACRVRIVGVATGSVTVV